MAFITAAAPLVKARHQQNTQIKVSRCKAVRAAMPVPLNDRVLIRLDKAPEKSSGGLVLTVSDESKKQRTGTVVAVGAGRYSPEGVQEREAVEMFEPGDKVLWKDEYGSEQVVTDDGESLLALRAFSVVAKFKAHQE